MALVWQESDQGNHYKVTRAGKSIRLYRNGVFHTQYHPDRIITGDIWELMLLGALGLTTGSRVLVLGGGGGAILNLLNHFIHPACIDVVELDSKVITICRDYFLTRKDNICFHHADAGQWVHRYSTRKRYPQYDLIIEDVFNEQNGQPEKVFDFNDDWLAGLSLLLASRGRLVMNFETGRQLKSSPVLKSRTSLKKAGFVSGLRFRSPRYQNNIAVFARERLGVEQIRNHIREDALLNKHRNSYFISALDSS